MVEKNKDWSDGVLECWSVGVLDLKAEIVLIFTLLPLVMRDPDMVYIFPLYLKGAVPGSRFKVQRLLSTDILNFIHGV